VLRLTTSWVASGSDFECLCTVRILLLYEGDMVLTPPFYVPIPILKGLHHVLSYWLAEKLLG
jgi:hypothetical protein